MKYFGNKKYRPLAVSRQRQSHTSMYHIWLLGKCITNAQSYIINHSKRPRTDPCGILQVIGDNSRTAMRIMQQCIQYISVLVAWLGPRRFSSILLSNLAQHLPSSILVCRRKESISSTVDLTLRNSATLLTAPPSFSAISTSLLYTTRSNLSPKILILVQHLPSSILACPRTESISSTADLALRNPVSLLTYQSIHISLYKEASPNGLPNFSMHSSFHGSGKFFFFKACSGKHTWCCPGYHFQSLHIQRVFSQYLKLPHRPEVFHGIQKASYKPHLLSSLFTVSCNN